MNPELVSLLGDLLLRGAVVLALLMLGALLFRRASASFLRRYWRCGLVMLLAASAVSLAPPFLTVTSNLVASQEQATATPSSTTAERMPHSERVSGASRVSLEDVMGLPASETASVAATETDNRSSETSSSLLTVPNLLVALWLSGALFLLLRKIVGSLAAWQLRRSTTEVTCSRWNDDLQYLLQELSLSSKVTLREHPALRSPIVMGLLRPIVILPSDHASFTGQERRAVLLHELSHVLHRDSLFRWITTLAKVLHWPNPLVWITERSLRLAEERSSDDSVLRTGIPGPFYAEFLSRLARGGTPIIGSTDLAGQSAMAQPSGLLPRVQAILHPKQTRSLPGIWSSFTLLTLGLGLALVIGGSTVTTAEAVPENDVVSKQGDNENAPKKALTSRRAQLEHKLDHTIVPSVEFEDANLDEVLEFLRGQSGGLNFIAKYPKLGHIPEAGHPKFLLILNRKITMRLTNVPLRAILDYACTVTKAHYTTTDHAIVVTQFPDDLSVTKNFKIPTERLMAQLELHELASVKDLLSLHGIQFRDGDRAFFTRATNNLNIRLGRDQLEIVEHIVDSLNGRPPRLGMTKAEAKRLADLKRALRETIIPEINFEDTPLRDALAYVRQTSARLRKEESASSPVQFMVNLYGLKPGDDITLKLRNVPLGIVIKHIADLAGGGTQISPHAIEIAYLTDLHDQLHLTHYHLSKENMEKIRESLDFTEIDDKTPKSTLEAVGIPFPEGTAAFWNPETGDLIAWQTLSNLNQIESLLDGLTPSKE